MSRQLIYWSGTGVTKRIAERLGGVPLFQYDGESEYILVFPSYGSPRTGGYVPAAVKNFLAEHHERLVAVAGVGNLTFGSDFCLGAVKAARHFRVPLIARIDMVPTAEELATIELWKGEGECQ